MRVSSISNIESIQQTPGITLEKAYTYSPIPLVWLVSMRSLCVILLIVAHVLKYVSKDSPPSEPAMVANASIEQPEQPITIMEEKPKPKALPSPKKRTANGDNLERVRVYMVKHQSASVRQVAKDLALGISTANK